MKDGRGGVLLAILVCHIALAQYNKLVIGVRMLQYHRDFLGTTPNILSRQFIENTQLHHMQLYNDNGYK